MRFILEEFGNPTVEDRSKLDYSQEMIWYPVNYQMDMAAYLMGLMNLKDYDELDQTISKIYETVERQAGFSNCQRAKIGCVVKNIKNDVWSYGYNDYPINQDVVTCCKDIGCNPTHSCRVTVHAEVSALLEMSNEHDRHGHIIFCSAAPCLDCQKFLALRGVRIVMYKNDRPQPEYDRPAMSWIVRNSGIKFIRVIN
jgi:deoxycytidylate deaminase